MDPVALCAKLARRLTEDEHFLYVDKPAGLAVTASARAPAKGLGALSLLFETPTLRPVGPLDRHTSGVLPLAKSADAATRLAEAWRSPRTVVTYQAVVDTGPGGRHLGRQRSRKSSETTLAVQVLRSRRGQALISFRHPGLRTAEVRASLRDAGMPLLGEGRRKPDQPPKRPVARLFLHRAELQFRHPFTGRTVTVKTQPPPAFAEVFGAGDRLEDTLKVALAGRIPCLLEPDTDACRLITGKAEGVAGLVVDRLGPVIVVQTHQGKFVGDQDRIRRIGKWYARILGSAAVYHKRFVKTRADAEEENPELHTAKPLLGKPVDEEVPVHENGLTFLVRPYDGYSTGLFLDQRHNRRRVRDLAVGGRVFNAFAYTCGFSVAAAVGGAVETVSVDISARALDWGRRNFAANGIALDNHLFFRSEVFAYLARASRQSRRFDLIILDAPTFARSKRPTRVFSIDQHLKPLIVEACGVLVPGGTMLVSTNNRTRPTNWLREQIAAAAAEVKRPIHMIGAPGLPPDFAADPGHAKSVFVRFD